MRTVLDMLEEMQRGDDIEVKRELDREWGPPPSRHAPSKSALFVLALSKHLEFGEFRKQDGWTWYLDGARAHERGEKADEYTLEGNLSGPDRGYIRITSWNDAERQIVSAALSAKRGTRAKKKVFVKVSKGDAKKVAAWVIDAAQEVGLLASEQ